MRAEPSPISRERGSPPRSRLNGRLATLAGRVSELHLKRAVPPSTAPMDATHAVSSLLLPRHRCPRCGSREVARSRTRHALERLGKFAGVYPYRCLVCCHRFRKMSYMLLP